MINSVLRILMGAIAIWSSTAGWGLDARSPMPNFRLSRAVSRASSPCPQFHPKRSLIRPNRNRPTMQPQGIEGTVMRLVGNHMPAATGANAQPVSTEVWVFQGRVPGRSTQWAIAIAKHHPQWLTCVRSDPTGRFFVPLEPGEYTLLARYDNYLYLNAFQGNGHYATVRVQANAVTSTHLVNTERATF